MFKRLPKNMHKRFKRLEKATDLNYNLLIFKAIEAGLSKLEQLVNSERVCSMDAECPPRYKKAALRNAAEM